MKTIRACFLMLAAVAGLLGADDRLLRLVGEKRWAESRELFADGSGSVLQERFAQAQAVSLQPAGSNRYTYFARFADRAEMGTLSLKAAAGRLTELRLSPIVTGMGFVASWARHAVSGLRLELGDARVELAQGDLYQALPQRGLFLFSGS